MVAVYIDVAKSNPARLHGWLRRTNTPHLLCDTSRTQLDGSCSVDESKQAMPLPNRDAALSSRGEREGCNPGRQ